MAEVSPREWSIQYEALKKRIQNLRINSSEFSTQDVTFHLSSYIESIVLIFSSYISDQTIQFWDFYSRKSTSPNE